MFGAIKKIFGRKTETAPQQPVLPPPRAAQLAAKPPSRAKVTPAPAKPPVPATPSAPAPAPAVTRKSTLPPGSEGDCLSVPFVSILNQVPAEWHGKLAPAGAGESAFRISRQHVIEQLPFGAVRVNFGELRRAAPGGVFLEDAKYDGQPVTLPLQEILKQLKPDSFARRTNQRPIEVDADLPDLFGPEAAQRSQARVLSKKEAQTSMYAKSGTKPVDVRPPTLARPEPQPPTKPAVAPVPSNTSKVAPKSPSAPAKSLPATKTAPSVPTSTPASGQLPQPMPSDSAPESQPVSAPKISAHSLPPMGPAGSAAGSVQARAAQPAHPPASKPPAVPKISAPSLPAPASVRTAAPPVPAQPAATEIAHADNPLVVPLLDLVQNWPEKVQLEVARLEVPDAQLVLPGKEVGAAIKRGRIEYPWQKIHSWIQPAPTEPCSPELAETPVELPLKLIVSAYLACIKRGAGTRKTDVSEAMQAVPDAAAAPAPTLAPAPATASVPAPATKPAAPTQPADAKSFLTLELKSLSEHWPEAIRREVERGNLGSLKVALPLDAIEGGLRYGKVELGWKQLCDCIQDLPPGVPAPANTEARLLLPLNVVAPLFMQLRAPARQTRNADLSHIPDVFSGGRAPAPKGAPGENAPAVPASPAKPAVVPAPAPVAKKPPQNLAELFGEPNKRNWTPNEIVHRTCGLPGVAGTLIALQDGLLVAQCMPPEWKTETLAAFLPQIFGRMTQYTKELKMGEVKHITLAVEQGVIQIFNAGIIYFAALAKTGAELPKLELNIIATELSRHTK